MERERLIRFGVFEVDLQTGELRKHGIRIKLREQPFQILSLLLEHPSQVVTREDLQRKLWPTDTFVDFDHGLNRAVNQLRDALGDSPDKPRFIETFPKRGYRFIAPVEGANHAEVPAAPPAPPAAPRPEPEPARTDGSNLRSGIWLPAAAAPPATPSPEPEPARTAGSNLRARIWLPAAAAPPAAPSPEPEPARTAGSNLRARIWLPAAAALMLIALAAAWFYSRTAHAPTEPNTVVLAEFDNHTGDPAFDYALKQALKIDLQQSPFLKILSDQQIADTLRQMGRRPDEGLTQQVARELCVRAGGKAVLGGSVARLGNEYVLNLDALNCQTGEVLGEEQVRAGAKEEVLGGLDRAASNLRGKLGESLSSIRKSDRPLNDFLSTKSLEAFQAYVNGQKMVQQKGRPYGIPFFRRAADLDSNFAFAYFQLAVLYGHLGEGRLSAENALKAYGLRDGVSEAERFPFTAQYYLNVTQQPERAISICQVWSQTYPRDGSAHDRATGAYTDLGEPEHALAESLQAYEMRGDLAITLHQLARAYLFLNRLEDARTIYRKNSARSPDQLFWRQGLYLLGFFDGDAGRMEEQVAWALRTPGTEDQLLEMHANTNAYFGHVEKSRELNRQAVEFSQRNDFKERAAMLVAREALWEAWLGNSETATRQARTALGLVPGRDVRALAALALAHTGDRNQAGKLANQLDAEFPASTLIHSYWLPTIRAEIELHAHNYSRAIELLRATAPYELADTPAPLAPVYVRGEAYLEARQGEAANAEFQKILEHRGMVGSSPVGALARLGVARAYAVSGETAKARSGYQDLLKLWQGADKDVAVVKQAQAEYAKIN